MTGSHGEAAVASEGGDRPDHCLVIDTVRSFAQLLLRLDLI